MGRRSRKRSVTADVARSAAPATVPAPAAPAALRRKARVSERPPAPWGPVPLTEVATLAGLIALVTGFALRSTTVLVVGFAVVAVFAIELAVREHLAGFRSHTTLIAGAAAMGVGAPLVALGAPRTAQLAGAAAAFAGVWIAMRRAFRDRAGGMGFRA